MSAKNIKVDQTVFEDNLAAGHVSFGTEKLAVLDWSVYLFPQDDDRYPGVREVSLTDDKGNEFEWNQLKEAILKHIGKE
jgi:hypothetical protein